MGESTFSYALRDFIHVIMVKFLAEKITFPNYFNRKGFYSIILQAVVNYKKKFLDICVSWPGSTHDIPYKDIEISFEMVSHVITACCILHNICEERHDFLPLGEQYNDTGTGINNEINISETFEGNIIKNAICDSL
ncbi:hypothetical protein C1646_771477 [Rhizophagus diaphanus]|nr:hypothetical protein C1646_771477 [Rhizophagus diaphanus] [Rhizophagus sp. MUCL 43196]